MKYRKSFLFILILHLLVHNCITTDDGHKEPEDLEHDQEVSIADTDDDTDDTNITPEPKVIKEPKVLKDPTEDPVIYLNDITFPPFIEQHQLVLVDFVTPEGCDRCKMYLKSYQVAAEILQEQDPPIPLVRINGERNPKLIKKYQIAKYPTLLFFKNGQPYQHHGQRGYDALVEFMLERAKPDWKYTAAPKVDVLTKRNMTSYLKNKPLALVKFYSPNCPVCKKFNLGEEEAANYMEEHLYPHVPYAKVDISANRQLAHLYNVTDIPTFKVFRKGVAFDFKSKKTDAISIVSHMNEQNKIASERRNSREQIEESSKKLESTIVGFFTNEQSEHFTLFQDAINHFRELVPLLHCFDKETMEYYKITPGTVLVFPPKFFHSKRWEPDFHEFVMDNRTQDELLEFLWESVAPVVGFRGRDNADYLYTFRPLMVVYFELDFSSEHKETTDNIRKQVVAVSEQVIGVQFCVSHELEFEDELVDMGLEDHMGSVSAVYYDERNIKHPIGFNDNFIGLDLKKFALKCLAGKCKPRFKSQPIPKSNSEPMKVIVADSFDKEVNKTKKNVVLALYSLGGERSETYMPTVETLAKMFKDEKDLVVARMNIDANDIPLPLKRDILPTIYFVKASNKWSPILYEDVDVNLDSLVQFVQKNLSEERELNMKEEL